MKNIFKKNQIIITALFIMIAIAGYLKFSGNNEDKIADVGSNEVLDYDTYTETAGDNILEGSTVTLDEDAVGVNLLDKVGLDPTANSETSDETVAKGTENTDAATIDENVADTQTADAAEVADISDEDAAAKDAAAEVAAAEDAAQLGVSDTGEVIVDDKDTSAPGEAILVSTTISASYFSTAKLTREQTRARSKETLMGIVDDANVEKTAQEDAINSVINLTAIAEKENAAETLLEAKGFSDAVVSITEGSDIDGNVIKGCVDVIINTTSITEQDVAQIEDIVKRKTGVKSSSEIFISPVTVEE